MEAELSGNSETMLKNWLALMVGNSRLHWAWFQGTNLRLVWHVPHAAQQAMAELIDRQLEFKPVIEQWLERGDITPEIADELARIPPALPLWYASVVPSQTPVWQQYVQLHRITLEQVPLAGQYPTLGIDRALALWGAMAAYGAPCLVIDAGTALTLTGADRSGQLVGGAILPGLRLQFQSLFEHTAALPALSSEWQRPISRWATNTIESIQSGVFYTVLAGLQDFITAWQSEFPQSAIVLTGGDASQLIPGLTQLQRSIDPSHWVIQLDRDLIFRGICRVWQEQDGSTISKGL